jgi:hypothetical protein
MTMNRQRTGRTVSVVLNLRNGDVNPLGGVSIDGVARIVAAYAGGEEELVLEGGNGVTTRYLAADITSVTISRVPWNLDSMEGGA